MTKSLDLANELSKRNATPFSSFSGAFVLKDETPAHQFTTVVMPILKSGYCLALPSRDFFDEGLATAVLNFIAKQSPFILASQRPLVLLEEFACPPYTFDSIAVLSPAAARQFEHDNDVLNERAFVAFPIYRCELSGDESSELVDLIRHDFLPSLDWKRLPCPKVTMAYQNKKNRAGSRPELTKLATALSEVEELYGAGGSWVELENYAGRKCHVTWNQGHFAADFPGQESATFDKRKLIDRIKGFLTHNTG